MSLPLVPSLHLVALGGLGEIGMNMMVYEYAGQLLIVDCGLTFPTPETPGVDLIIPDTRYLDERREMPILGYLLTHGHEDHIGALPYIWPRYPAPVYGTPMTLGLLEGKFREHQLLDRVSFHRLQPRVMVRLGPFTVTPIQMTHSIIDGVSLAIETPLGTVVHTGDFKIDHTPVDNRPSDLYTLARLGEEGVLALLSDSTNVQSEGCSVSEREIRETFDALFPKATGMIIVATFSSNIQRIRQVMEAAAAAGRRVLLSGRSMETNVQIARSLGYLSPPPNLLVEAKAATKLPRGQLLVLSTGSQGEPNSSLSRIVRGDHREIRILPGDLVVLSSKFIPGNEPAITDLINRMVRLGARVEHEQVSEVHVSGHGSREELKLMLALTRPRFFIPVHGEMRHLHAHRSLAIAMGVPESQTLVAENGELIRLDGHTLSIQERVSSGKVFVDGKGVGDIRDIVMRDRLHLSEDGLVAVVIILDKVTNQLLLGPELFSHGVVHEDDGPGLLDAAAGAVLEALSVGPKGMDFADEEGAGPKELTIRALRRFFKKRLGRRPVVLPLVMEM